MRSQRVAASVWEPRSTSAPASGWTGSRSRIFGITAGYNFQYFEVDNTVANRTFTVKQTLHGPLPGIGFYF
jgi:hypothetical protein